MSAFLIKSTLENYFMDNWTQTEIQFEGQTFDYSSLDKFISLKYVGVRNKGMLGSKHTNAQIQVFCYAKNPTLAYKLCDDVATFIQCKDLDNDIHTGIPQQSGSAINLDNEFFEVMLYNEINKYS